MLSRRRMEIGRVIRGKLFFRVPDADIARGFVCGTWVRFSIGEREGRRRVGRATGAGNRGCDGTHVDFLRRVGGALAGHVDAGVLTGLGERLVCKGFEFSAHVEDRLATGLPVVEFAEFGAEGPIGLENAGGQYAVHVFIALVAVARGGMESDKDGSSVARRKPDGPILRESEAGALVQFVRQRDFDVAEDRGVLAALGAFDRISPGLEVVGVPGGREIRRCGMDGAAYGSGPAASVVVDLTGSGIADPCPGAIGDGGRRGLPLGAGVRADGEMGESHWELQLTGGTPMLDRVSDRGGVSGGLCHPDRTAISRSDPNGAADRAVCISAHIQYR